MTWPRFDQGRCGPECTYHVTRTPMDEIGGVGSPDRTLPERPVQQPVWIREDNGDLVQVWVEETPSERLPSYQTGRVPIQDRVPVDPADAFQRELIRRRPFLGPAVEKMARDLQKQDRPSIIRRILNATRRNT